MSYTVAKLRYYQKDAVKAIEKYFVNNDGNPLVVLPTGSGKSHVIAAFVKRVLEYPDQRVIMLTHVHELIEQNHNKLLNHWWNAPAGVYSDGLKRYDMYHAITYAGIQSIYKKSHEHGAFNIIIIDEAHLINMSSTTMYQRFIADQKRLNPYVKVVGLTATPFRTKTGDLTKGDNTLFNDICYNKPIIELIDEGYLCPLVSKRTVTDIDLSSVKTRAGEYVNKDLQAATDKDEITQAAVNEIIQYGNNRKSWLVFCAGVEHAQHVCDALIERGISAGTISNKTSKGERNNIVKDFKAGKIKALTGCNIFTTGFDAPQVDLIALLRATKSPGLYVQMAGRGTRLAEGKKDCLVLDFAGNVMRHGAVDQVEAWTPKKNLTNGGAPIKDCPRCKSLVHASLRKCPQCDYEFEVEEKPKHHASSDNTPILSIEKIIEEHVVDHVTFNLHHKYDGDGPPTIRVSYRCGMDVYREWIPIFHTRGALARAKRFWSQFVPDTPFPTWKPWEKHEDIYDDVDETLREHYKKPYAIVVNLSGKYASIVNYVMEPKKQNVA